MEYDWGAKVGYLSGDFILLLTHLVSHHWVLHIQDLLRNQVPGFKGPSFFLSVRVSTGRWDIMTVTMSLLLIYIYIHCIYIDINCVYEPGPRTPTPPPPMVSPPTPNPPTPQNLVFACYLHIYIHIYTYIYIYIPLSTPPPSHLYVICSTWVRATTSSTDLVYLYISIITFFSNRL